MDESRSGRDEIRILRDSARDFVKRHVNTRLLRQRRQTLPGYDTALVAEMQSLGWLGILVPEAYDGLGLGFAEMSVVLNELSRGMMAEPLSATVVLGGRLLLHGKNQALMKRLLPTVAAGNCMPALAWQEPGNDGLHHVPQLVADSSGDGFRLSGLKHLVAGAGDASGFIVSARCDKGLGLFWVEAGDAAIELQHAWRADGTPASTLRLAGARVEPEAIVAVGALAEEALACALDETTVMLSAELVGVMGKVMDMTLEYLRTRVQFGRPIGSFQALQHRAVDLFIQQQLSLSVLEEACRTLDATPTALERARIASRVKSRCSDAGLRIVREAIQLHGAIGMTDELDLGLYVKRALVLAAWLGNGALHRERFAQLPMTQAASFDVPTESGKLNLA